MKKPGLRSARQPTLAGKKTTLFGLGGCELGQKLALPGLKEPGSIVCLWSLPGPQVLLNPSLAPGPGTPPLSWTRGSAPWWCRRDVPGPGQAAGFLLRRPPASLSRCGRLPRGAHTMALCEEMSKTGKLKVQKCKVTRVAQCSRDLLVKPCPRFSGPTTVGRNSQTARRVIVRKRDGAPFANLDSFGLP